ncbi:MAG: hypothetical protein NC176_08830 [Treponema brennaborense]|nr:hypothetical protein [Prevotella sp.]MCM1408563.1 hypothetical protein [Treponema brennaborense]
MAIGIWKFDSIKRILVDAGNKAFLKRQISEAILETFNNDIDKDVLNDALIVNQNLKTVTFLFLGNSLTYCSAPEEEADKTRRGLASTKIENDYVHRLVSMYAEKHNVNVRFSAVNIANFERGFTKKEFSKDVTDSLLLGYVHVENPDFVIFQIGENVSQEDISENGMLFFERYCALVNSFENAKKVICLPFWPHKEKINIITDVALATESVLCDLSHLGSGLDSDNFASSCKKYRQLGVGIHPGDTGMDRIAKNIFSVLSE